jgi:hypothetical protein
MIVSPLLGRPRESAMNMPMQSPPVYRDDRPSGSPGQNSAGVEAAQSRCSHMTGMARQMCYATLYGVSV